jgi:trans-2,3-dihydro-3-hydroxyanthranilate isomerase
MILAFSLIDVFTNTALAGNPLALIPDAEELDDATMKSVAREFNQSETTFVLPPSQDGAAFRLRSFTPSGAEVFGAGHNALGAWWWLAITDKLSLEAGFGRFVQEIGDRVLEVEVIGHDGRPRDVWMDQTPPTLGQKVSDLAELAGALGLDANDLEGDAQVVSTGTPHLLVQVSSRAIVNLARPDFVRLAAVLRETGGQGCYLYSLDVVRSESAAHARFFNPTVAIWEDPATGSAAGPLGTQLVAHGVVSDGSTTIIEQGYAMGRPSRIQVSVHGQRVRIGGPSVVVAEGELRI